MTLYVGSKVTEKMVCEPDQEEENPIDDNDIEIEDEENSMNTEQSETSNEPWVDEEDRIANFYITTNPLYNQNRLPKTIKIRNPMEGEIPFFVKRSYPKAARMHKKREDNDPHRFFLSELMLYTGYTDEQQLGADDEKNCRDKYLKKKDAIQL